MWPLWCVVISMLALVIYFFWYVPRVCALYGKMYFDASSEQRPKNIAAPVSGAIASLILMIWFLAVPARFSNFTMCGIIGMGAALYGALILDRAWRVIPDRFQLLGLLSASLSQVGPGGGSALVPRLLLAGGLVMALLLLGTIYKLVCTRAVMGNGDIKLLGWIAVAFGIRVLHIIVYAGGVMVLWILLRLWLWRKWSNDFAFGPAIALGVALCLGLDVLSGIDWCAWATTDKSHFCVGVY